MKGRQGEARSSFDLPFEGKEEKVVIDSALYSSFSFSLFSFFNQRARAEKSYSTVTGRKTSGYRQTGK